MDSNESQIANSEEGGAPSTLHSAPDPPSAAQHTYQLLSSDSGSSDSISFFELEEGTLRPRTSQLGETLRTEEPTQVAGANHELVVDSPAARSLRLRPSRQEAYTLCALRNSGLFLGFTARSRNEASHNDLDEENLPSSSDNATDNGGWETDSSEEMTSPNSPGLLLSFEPEDEGFSVNYEAVSGVLSDLDPTHEWTSRMEGARTALAISQELPLRILVILWDAMSDLASAPSDEELRATVWKFAEQLVKRPDLTKEQREHIFDSTTPNPSELDAVLEANAVWRMINPSGHIAASTVPTMTEYRGTSLLQILTKWLKPATAGMPECLEGALGPDIPPVICICESLVLLIGFKGLDTGLNKEELYDLVEATLKNSISVTTLEEKAHHFQILEALAKAGIEYPDALFEQAMWHLYVICGQFANRGIADDPIRAVMASSMNARALEYALRTLSHFDEAKLWIEVGEDLRLRMQVITNTISGIIKMLTMMSTEFKHGEERYIELPVNEVVTAVHASMGIRTPVVDTAALRLCLCMFNQEDQAQRFCEMDSFADTGLILRKSYLQVLEWYRVGPPKDLDSNTSARVRKLIDEMDDLMKKLLDRFSELWLAGRLKSPHKATVSEMILNRSSEVVMDPVRRPEITVNPVMVNLVLEYFAEEGWTSPDYTDEWHVHCQNFVNCFLARVNPPTPGPGYPRTPSYPHYPDSVRLQTHRALMTTYRRNDFAFCYVEKGILPSQLRSLRKESHRETFEAGLAAGLEYALRHDYGTFTVIIDEIVQIIKENMYFTEDRTTNPVHRLLPTFSCLATNALIVCFLRSINTDAAKAIKAYECLLEVAKNGGKKDAKMGAVKILFRVRADSNCAIMVVKDTECEHLAAVLGRTKNKDLIALVEADKKSDAPTLRPKPRPHSGLPPTDWQGEGLELNNGPLWMYGELTAFPPREQPPSEPSPLLYSCKEAIPKSDEKEECGVLPITHWLEFVIDQIQMERKSWELYSYYVVHLSGQLACPALFKKSAEPAMKLLGKVIIHQIRSKAFLNPPYSTVLKKGDVAICFYEMLLQMLNYKEFFTKGELRLWVNSYAEGIGQWDFANRHIFQALFMCCFELPQEVLDSLGYILTRMAMITSQAHAAQHVLEFLAVLPKLPITANGLSGLVFKEVFGICVRYLQICRDQFLEAEAPVPASSSSNNASGQPGRSENPRELIHYIYTLAHHVMIYWFLALRLYERQGYVSWIVRNLAWPDMISHQVIIEEQSQVFLDMMQRTAFSNLGETEADLYFSRPEVKKLTKSWLDGLSIVTIDTDPENGYSQVTKRQASGTSHFLHRLRFSDLPAHHAPLESEPIRPGSGPAEEVQLPEAFILPSHMFLQMTSSAALTPNLVQAIVLPDEEYVQRAISTFDRIDTVDGHKAGVVYVGEGQNTESQILANTSGSEDYNDFIAGLGYKMPLKDAKFNTQGLDKVTNADGEYTFAWRDRISEIVFHITTLMPTDLENDPQSTRKKSHVGNDFVNVVFNDSKRPFNFDTIPSAFNFVNIVVSPAAPIASSGLSAQVNGARSQYYKVQLMTKKGVPTISPAADWKMVSAAKLPELVRYLAINASMFVSVWTNERGEYNSNWRKRLLAIKQLKNRVKPGPASPKATNGVSSGTNRSAEVFANRRASLFPDHANAPRVSSSSSSLADRTASTPAPLPTDSYSSVWASGDDQGLVQNIDFARWT